MKKEYIRGAGKFYQTVKIENYSKKKLHTSDFLFSLVVIPTAFKSLFSLSSIVEPGVLKKKNIFRINYIEFYGYQIFISTLIIENRFIGKKIENQVLGF